MDSTRKIAVVGIPRSGTNLLQTILTENFSIAPSSLWKHAFADEIDQTQRDDATIILVTKHPVMWFQSCHANRSGVFLRDRWPLLLGSAPEIGLAQLYMRFHQQWLDAIAGGNGIAVKFEGLANGHLEPLLDFLASEGYQIPEGRPMRWQFDRLPASVQFSDTDRARSINCETDLAPALARSFWDALDPALTDRLGYRWESVRFATAATPRRMAYRLVESRTALSMKELVTLKTEARTLFAEDGTVLRAIGNRLQRDGNEAEALTWYLMACAALQKEIASFGARTDASMTYADLLDDITRVCAGLKGEALSLYAASQIADEQHAEGWPPIKEALWQTLVGQISSHRGRFDDAIARANDAAKLAPDNGWYRFNLGRLLMNAGRLEEAEIELRKSIASDPRDATRHFLLSDVLGRQGQVEAACAEAASAIEGNRVEPWYFHHYAALLVRCGKIDEAKQRLQQAIEREPQIARHYYFLSELLSRCGQLEEAIESSALGLACAGAEAWFFHHHGGLLSRAGRLEEAEARLREAITRNFFDARHHRLLSEILERQGKIKEATVAARAALTGDNVEAEGFYRYGLLLIKQGTAGAARFYLQKAVELKPEVVAYREALAGLEQA